MNSCMYALSKYWGLEDRTLHDWSTGSDFFVDAYISILSERVGYRKFGYANLSTS